MCTGNANIDRRVCIVKQTMTVFHRAVHDSIAHNAADCTHCPNIVLAVGLLSAAAGRQQLQLTTAYAAGPVRHDKCSDNSDT